MNQRIRSVCMVAVGIAAVSTVAEGQTIRIKDSAEVTGSQVRLGDVAAITGVSAEQAETFARVPICTAPMPGVARDIGADYLVARARSRGVLTDEMNVEGAGRTRVTSRSGNVLTPESLALMLEEYILDEMPWARHEAEITCVPIGRPLNLPAGRLDVRIEHKPGHGFVGEGVFPTSVFLDDQRVRSMYLKAHVEVYRPVVVANEFIRRGAPIRAGQLSMCTVSLSEMKGDYFLEPEAVAGMVARRDIASGATLTSDRVELPILVECRDDVLLMHKAGAVEIAMKVRARTQGRLGDVIAVENLSSRKTLNVVVTGPGEVTLP